MKRVITFITVIILITFIRSVFAASFPAPTGFVNDFAGILNSQQKTDLEQNLQNFRDQTGNEIAVAILRDLNGDTIENAAVKMFEEWKIGQKGKDNGVLLLVAIDDRKLKIEVGYGLEPLLTDARSGDIIRNVITPKFKQGNYYDGIKDGLVTIQNLIVDPNAQIPAAGQTGRGFNFDIFVIMGVLIWFFVPLAVYLAAFLGRSKRIWPGGAAGLGIGAVIGLIVSSLLAVVILSLILGIIGLLLDWFLSSNYERLKKMGKATGWTASRGGFWTGGGDGFGGFSGGSSGGGGSSGSW